MYMYMYMCIQVCVYTVHYQYVAHIKYKKLMIIYQLVYILPFECYTSKKLNQQLRMMFLTYSP